MNLYALRSEDLSKIRGCVYYPFPTHLLLNNLAKHQNEREEERVSRHTPPEK